jgi:hypothetical protein
MNPVYNILESIRQELSSNVLMNTVSFGDLTEIDLNKTTMFPLSHIIMEQSTIGSNVLSFNLRIIIADIVDISNQKESSDDFYGNDNMQDVLNSMYVVAQRVAASLYRGDKYRDLFRIESNPVLEPFMDRFQNLLAGWEMTMTITVPNTISIDDGQGNCS